MALPTTTLSGSIQSFDGAPVATGSVILTPSGFDVDAATGALVAVEAVEAKVVEGIIQPVEVYPNSAGIKGTTYAVTVKPGNKKDFALGSIYVTEADATLGDLVLAGATAAAAGAARAIMTTAAKYQADLTAGKLQPNALYLVKG